MNPERRKRKRNDGGQGRKCWDCVVVGVAMMSFSSKTKGPRLTEFVNIAFAAWRPDLW